MISLTSPPPSLFEAEAGAIFHLYYLATIFLSYLFLCFLLNMEVKAKLNATKLHEK